MAVRADAAERRLIIAIITVQEHSLARLDAA